MGWSTSATWPSLPLAILVLVSDGGGKADREERQTDGDGWIDWQALWDVAHKQTGRHLIKEAL